MRKSANILLLISLSLLTGCGVKIDSIDKTTLKCTYDDVYNNYAYTCNAFPNKGTPNLLVIPVYFTDSVNYIAEDKKDVVRSDIETTYFGTKAELKYESVTSYYSTLSNKKVEINGKVADWYIDEHASTDYGNDYAAVQPLVNAAVDDYFTKNPLDSRLNYDSDQDGFLDGIAIVYGAPDYLTSKKYKNSNLWAYTSWITEAIANTKKPVTCNYMWISYDFMYSKSLANTKLGNEYGNGDTSVATLDAHTFIHEMGHMFGLQDYYDYSEQYRPAGTFSMQDYNVGCHDPFSVMALGWANPYIPTESCTLEIGKFQKTHELILLTNKWNEYNSPFDEYLLLELYSPDGLNAFDNQHVYKGNYPTGANTVGIRLWHVDARLLYLSGGSPKESQITTNPNLAVFDVYQMMSNTYYSSHGTGSSYLCPLGKNYYDFNLLQLIRYDFTDDYHSNNYFDDFALFKAGSTFNMKRYRDQFVNETRFNSNLQFTWTFTVRSVGDTAVINLIKA